MAQEVTVDELEQAIAAGEFVVDVRESFEFEDGHVPQAKHIPLNSIPENLADLPKDKKIWIICASGGRSMTAANFLEQQGLDCVSVAGGTSAWIGSGKTVSFDASI
jgi:rhodanese-related sulfurtransferase